MMSKNERLEWARKRKGFETASEAADALSVPRPTYLAHENGSRGFTLSTGTRYASFYGVRPEWLVLGQGAPTSNKKTVQIVGYVGAGSEVTPVDDYSMGDGLETVESPPIANEETIVAVRVRGGSMWPAYRDGDVLYYSDIEQDPADLIGKECVVKLIDGRICVKTIQRGGIRSSFTLNSYNAEPMYDQMVEWAAPIRWIKRA